MNGVPTGNGNSANSNGAASPAFPRLGLRCARRSRGADGCQGAWHSDKRFCLRWTSQGRRRIIYAWLGFNVVPLALLMLRGWRLRHLEQRRIALEAEGYRITTYTDGVSALEGFKTTLPDLAILDIKMPRMDGMETLRRLRQKSDLPVIFLTSKDEQIDELFGLKIGADDFIRKPFSQRLLVERVKAVLRRAAKDSATPKDAQNEVLERGLLRMDPERHTCTWKNAPVALTVTEFLILQALASRPGIVKSRNALMDAAYDDQVYVDDRTIDSHVKRLRKKFKASDVDFDMIETLYGVGYRIKEFSGAPKPTAP